MILKEIKCKQKDSKVLFPSSHQSFLTLTEAGILTPSDLSKAKIIGCTNPTIKGVKMFKRILIIAFVAISLCMEVYSEEPKPAVQDCKVICEKCGFYVSQTDDHLDKLKASYENEDDFYIVMDDWMHYLYTTEKYLEVNGIQANFYTSPVEKCPTLFFGDYPLEVSKINSYFIFILYEKGKEPYVIQDIVMSEDEINAYFNITNPKYYKREE